ncbi:MAG TPA: BrnT family toxin [Burkholderiaceae bacterium]|nr:BrnT family toxin [Burkholderiaceae bacterium]
MQISFDPAKDDGNLRKHGVSLALAVRLEWETALCWDDGRRDYGEPRQVALGYIGQRLYSVVFVDRDEVRRIISLRKANSREVRRYAET